jgi:hypothetical protein
LIVVVDRFLLAAAIRYLPLVLPFTWREASTAYAAASTVALWLLAAVGGDYDNGFVDCVTTDGEGDAVH